MAIQGFDSNSPHERRKVERLSYLIGGVVGGWAIIDLVFTGDIVPDLFSC
jgi:hypothetical protein